MGLREDREREVDEQMRGLERQDWIELAEGLVVAVACILVIIAVVWALPRLSRIVVELWA